MDGRRFKGVDESKYLGTNSESDVLNICIGINIMHVIVSKGTMVLTQHLYNYITDVCLYHIPHIFVR